MQTWLLIFISNCWCPFDWKQLVCFYTELFYKKGITMLYSGWRILLKIVRVAWAIDIFWFNLYVCYNCFPFSWLGSRLQQQPNFLTNHWYPVKMKGLQQPIKWSQNQFRWQLHRQRGLSMKVLLWNRAHYPPLWKHFFSGEWCLSTLCRGIFLPQVTQVPRLPQVPQPPQLPHENTTLSNINQ